MQVVNKLDEARWAEAVYANPTGNIFHTPEMFAVFERTEGYEPVLWAAVEGGEVLALLAPVSVTLMDGVFRSFTTRAIAYGSVMAAPGAAGEEALAALLDAYTAGAGGGALFTELRNLCDLTPVQPVLERAGFAFEDHLNYLVDLSRLEDEIMAGISSRTRSYIRRGLRDPDLAFREVTDRAEVRTCYDLLQHTYETAQVPLAPPSLFEALFDVLYPKGMARFTLAIYGGTPVAVTVDLFYKNVVYYWYGGMDREHASRHPNEPLRWHIFQTGRERGCTVFDFGGAGRPDEDYGVRDFKAKFGGQLVAYGRNVCVHSALRLNVSKLGYQVLRRFL